MSYLNELTERLDVASENGHVPMNDETYARLAAAIGIVADRAIEEDGDRLAEFEESELARIVEDDHLTDPDLVLGRSELALILLMKLEKVGQMPADVLPEIARRYRPS